MSNDWLAQVPDDVAHRRAGGRRHYNAWRQFMAMRRRRKVARLLRRGYKQAQIARRLSAHPSTISRDVAWLNELANRTRCCPLCGHEIGPRWLELVSAKQDEWLDGQESSTEINVC